MENIEEEILELKKLAVRKMITEDSLKYLNQLDVRMFLDLNVKQMIYEPKIIYRNEFNYPEDWKQAFKLKHFPRFLLKRFPVRYKQVEVVRITTEITEHWELHPELSCEIKEDQDKLRVLTFNQQ